VTIINAPAINYTTGASGSPILFMRFRLNLFSFLLAFIDIRSPCVPCSETRRTLLRSKPRTGHFHCCFENLSTFGIVGHDHTLSNLKCVSQHANTRMSVQGLFRLGDQHSESSSLHWGVYMRKNKRHFLFNSKVTKDNSIVNQVRHRSEIGVF
jgi:hypothetical protein